MEKNQPNINAEPDPEMDAIRGKVPGLEAEPEPESAPAPEPKEPEPAPAAPVKPEPKAPEPKKEPEPVPDPAPKAPRPEKYIPVAQYVDEKKQWKGTLDEKDKRIAELEGIVNGKAGSKKTEEAVKEYADKYGVSEDSIRDLVSTIKTEFAAVAPEKKEETPAQPALSPEQQAQIDEANQIKAEQLFNQEYAALAIPSLKKAFPNATDAQLAAAKKEIEELACSKEYLDKSLDYVVFKEAQSLAEIFAPDRTGPESQRAAPQKGVPTFTAADFKDGKTPFSELSNLKQEDLNKIVEDMDLKTYEAYMHWVNQNDVLEVSRGGRKIT